VKRIIVCICAAIIVALSLWTRGAADSLIRSKDAPPRAAHLTAQGRLLWNFEALLKETLGGHQVCVSTKTRLGTRWNFTSGSCAPLSTYLFYKPVFARPRGFTFHIARRAVRSAFFGNYPEAVLIRGQLVACDAAEARYLVDYASGAGLTLVCLPIRKQERY